ncbi:MAG: hypothetical protein JWN44_4455 [Myxococcales bacterium]|nr:hypothetical protein [Myxococcales bacterium]
MTRLLLLAALATTAACNRSSASKPAPGTTAASAAATSAPAQRPAAGTIAVIVDGKPAGVWTTQQIAAAGTVAMNNQNGEEREAWPLKKVAQTLIGPKARVVALDAGNERVAIDEQQWNDPQRALVLRLSHRGAFKAHWLAGGKTDEAFLKGIERVEVVQ